MTLWKIGGIAMVRAEHADIAKAKLADTTDNPEWLKVEVEVVRVQGPEEILLIADAPQVEKPRRKQKST
jgi:hypothetical protein